ncbi:MAG: 4a-hydroxytetrahydrobiopterin dehydratase [Bacteroidales bacterium]|nr:4a-hydroxytetrahydrobiopterin dehydratase [Bacteroidales bacterium]
MDFKAFWIQNGDNMIKEYFHKDFLSSIYFVLRIGKVAEKYQQHPDILIHSGGRVKISIPVSEYNKFTEKDHQLAKMIDEVYSC